MLTKSSDVLDVHQLWSSLRQSYKLVLLIAALVFAAVMTLTFASRMSFRASSRLYLGELDESSKAAARNKDEIDIAAGSQGVVGSEIEIIQSRSLIARAVLDSGLNVSLTAQGASTPRYWSWLLSRRDPSILATDGELRSHGTVLTDERARPQSYTLRFTSGEEYEVWREQERLGKGRLGQVTRVAGADLSLLAGKQRGPTRGAEYVVLVRPLQEVIDAALAALKVTAPKPSPQSAPVNVLNLEFSHASPQLAAGFLERLTNAYLAERQSWKVEDAAAAEAFVESQLSQMRRSLDDVERKLADYRTNNRVVVLDNEAKAMIEQIGKYEEQRVAARLEVAALSDVQRTLKGPKPPVGAFLMGEANDSVLAGMASSLSEARQKLTDLESRFNEAAPDVRDQRGQVDAQLDSIRNYVSSRASRAQENLATLNGIIAQYEMRLKTVPGAELGLAQLTREAEVYNRTYSYLLERQQQTAIIKASTLSKNRVLDLPQAPYREDSPKLVLRLASAPLGLLLGVALVLARTLLSGTFNGESDVRTAAGARPLLATVPRRVRRRGEKRGLSGPGSFDVVGDDLSSSFAEAFRTLRARLYQILGVSSGRALLVTSPSEGDGKTTCALGLAAMLAADGKRVLLIDADLRRANHPEPAEPEERSLPGLREVLRGEQAWSDAVRTVRAGAGHFYVIGSGGVAPAELLSHRRMAGLLEDARKRCDFVLLDAPCYPAVADSLVLAGLVDAVVSVVRPGSTNRRLAQEHWRGLESPERPSLVLLNAAGESGPSLRAAKPPVPRQLAVAAPAGRVPRWRALAWWVGALLMLGAATAAFYSQELREASARAMTTRRGG
jgi:tyrosine-protein kinase Etk/Wzc